MSTATVSAKTIRAALLVARTAGIDVGPALERHGARLAMLDDPDARFAHDLWLALWREIDASGPGAFGLRAAKALPVGHFDVLDYTMASSADFGSGLELFSKYFAIVSTGVAHVIVPDVEGVRLERRYAPGNHTTIPHPAEFAFGCLVLRTRTMLANPWRPREIRFAHRRPPDDREHREVFDCPLVFDAESSAIVIDRTTLAMPMPKPEPELVRILERHGDAMLAKLPAATSDLRARTKEAILFGLRGGNASVGAVAKKLGTSDRTLQRRLGELGTSHAKLLDEARAELAVRYLEEPALAISEVAFLLGFADVSAFHRAFRRWTDSTPAEHRRSAVKASSSP